jgi:hypothetical protein
MRRKIYVRQEAVYHVKLNQVRPHILRSAGKRRPIRSGSDSHSPRTERYHQVAGPPQEADTRLPMRRSLRVQRGCQEADDEIRKPRVCQEAGCIMGESDTLRS